jgi:hypothetical protein
MRKLLQLDSAQVGVGFRQSYFGVYIDDYVVAPVGHFRGGPKLGLVVLDIGLGCNVSKR